MLAPSHVEAKSVAAQTLDVADQAFRDSDWATAAGAYQALAGENPYKGQFWYRLGAARYGLKEYEASAKAYAKAAELGYQKGTSLYNMGCDYALLGETEKAIDAIERAIDNGLRQREQLIREDTDLASIRDTESFRTRIMPAVDEGMSRTDGWRMDLDYLTLRMEATHYDLYRNVTPQEWSESITRISDNIDKLEDYEIIVELMKLVTLVGDGHTGVRTIGGPHSFHGIPVRFYVFKDGVFIRSAAPEYAEAVGKRVIRIGKLPVEEALERAATVTQHDNPMQIKWIAPRYLSIVEILDALDISDGLTHVNVVLADEMGREATVRFEPIALTPEISRHGPADSVNMRDDAPVPLWQKHPADLYWFEYIKEKKLVYFQFNSVRNKSNDDTIADFTERLFEFIDTNPVDALVIDVRLNNGGNNFLVKPIVDSIIRSKKINQRGSLFTIIGRETFSACQNFSNRLQRETQVTFVGEPTGSSPNFVGEGNRIELPYSGVRVNGSSRYWQDSLSDDFRIWVAPDLIAELTSTDYRTNHDPAMAVIFEYLEHQEKISGRASR